eukprot:205655_1
MATSKTLFLKVHDLLHGMIKLELDNIDELTFNEYHCQFTLSYKFDLKNNPNQHYENNAWNSKHFTANSIIDDGTFFIKIPQFLLPYSLEYNITVTRYDIDGSYEPDFNMLIDTFKSDTFTANVPSMFVESTFKIGQQVEYYETNSEFCREGIIIELLDNNNIKIQDVSTQNNLLRHSTKIQDFLKECEFVIDITNRSIAESELLLGTNVAENTRFYCMLYEYVNGIYMEQMYENIEQMKDRHNLSFFGNLVSINIYQFVFEKEYNYRIKCLFDDYILFCVQQWSFEIGRTIKKIKMGKEFKNPQTNHDSFGYSCDICRVETSWYEYVYICKCEEHAFCLSCIHSNVMQYKQMKPLISDILNGVLDDNTVEVIVMFCVGKVRQFYVDKDDVCMVEIDETPSIGSKRSITSDLSNNPTKRQKM